MSAKRKQSVPKQSQQQPKNKYVNVNEQLYNFGRIVQPIAVSPIINFLFMPYPNRFVFDAPQKLIMYENARFDEMVHPNDIPPNGIQIQ